MATKNIKLKDKLGNILYPQTKTSLIIDESGQPADLVSKTYVDTQDAATLASAKADATSKANTAETNAKAHSDANLATAKTYADGKAVTAEQNAKDYADGLDSVMDGRVTELEAAKTGILDRLDTAEADIDAIEAKPAMGIETADIAAWNGEIGAKEAVEAEETRAKGVEEDLQDQIDDIEAGLLKVKTGEKVLGLDATTKELSTTLSINYDSNTRKIQLKGIEGTLVSEFDASAFIKDGMLWGQKAFVASGTEETVSITKGTITQSHKFTGLTKGHQYLAFCFSDGEVPTPNYSWDIVDLQDLVDVYTAGNGLQLNNNEFSIKVDETGKYLSVSSAGLKVSGIDAAITAAVGVEQDRASQVEEGLASELEDVGNRLTTAEGEIDTLQEDSHTHSNKTILDNITAPYTTAEASKLAGIAAGAQVNVIEEIQLNGSKITPANKVVDITGIATTGDVTRLEGLISAEATTARAAEQTNAAGIAQNAADIAELDSSLVSLASRVSANETAISGLNTWKTSVNSDITDLKERMTSAETTISAHTASISDHETRITAIEGSAITYYEEITQ